MNNVHEISSSDPDYAIRILAQEVGLLVCTHNHENINKVYRFIPRAPSRKGRKKVRGCFEAIGYDEAVSKLMLYREGYYAGFDAHRGPVEHYGPDDVFSDFHQLLDNHIRRGGRIRIVIEKAEGETR